MLSSWVLVNRHVQITQNKFSYLCNLSRKAWEWSRFFLPADKRKRFQQDQSITLKVRSQECPEYPKQQVFNILQYLKENVQDEDEVDFLPANKRQRFL